MKFFTSDHHFGHANIIGYSQRTNPDTGELFATVEEMDDYLIRAWNSVVKPGDTVYHLGDLTKDRNPRPYLERLNGSIVLTRGNHDFRRVANLVPLAASQDLNLVSVHDTLMLRPDKGTHPHIWLSHYAHRVWPTSYHGSWHLYGHSHGTIQDHGLSTDVGVDTRQNDYRPYSVHEIVELMSGRPTPKSKGTS